MKEHELRKKGSREKKYRNRCQNQPEKRMDDLLDGLPEETKKK